MGTPARRSEAITGRGLATIDAVATHPAGASRMADGVCSAFSDRRRSASSEDGVWMEPSQRPCTSAGNLPPKVSSPRNDSVPGQEGERWLTR